MCAAKVVTKDVLGSRGWPEIFELNNNGDLIVKVPYKVSITTEYGFSLDNDNKDIHELKIASNVDDFVLVERDGIHAIQYRLRGSSQYVLFSNFDDKEIRDSIFSSIHKLGDGFLDAIIRAYISSKLFISL